MRYYFLLLLISVYSCGGYYLSDEELCKRYNEGIKGERPFKSYFWEITERLNTRLDSTTNGIEYHTILSAPPCAADYYEYYDEERSIRVVAYTEETVKDSKMHQYVQTDLNGLVVYHYRENSNGDLIKDYVTLPDSYRSESYSFTFKDDTVSYGGYFEAVFSLDKERVEAHEFHLFEKPDITLLSRYKLEKFHEDKFDIHYRYKEKIDSVGVHTFRCLLKILKTENSQWKEQKVEFRYLVSPPASQNIPN